MKLEPISRISGAQLKTLVLAALAVIVSMAPARPDAASGRMFGYQIGEIAEDFDRKKVRFEMLGPPWLERAPEHAAEKFDRLELLVTPYTGTILGMRVIADFEDLADADAFAQRMAAALSAKFGPSVLFHTWASTMGFGTCPYDDPQYICTSSDRDTDLYRTRIANLELSLSRYELAAHPAVFLIFGIDLKNPANGRMLEQLEAEYLQFEKWSAQELLDREKDGALRGMD